MTRKAAVIAREEVAEFSPLGVKAFTTTRQAGTFGLGGDDAVGEVLARWTALQEDLTPLTSRIVTGRQVHGAHVITHRAGWEGMLRTGESDGHLAAEKGIALAVSIADCVPVFMAHSSGIVGILHSGWKGTLARIIDAGINAYGRLGIEPTEIKIHLGPSICGRCYQVSADVRTQLTGEPAKDPGNVDIRSLIAGHARELGVCDITVSQDCTRCDNDRYFSHRAGDSGRQLAVIVAEP